VLSHLHPASCGAAVSVQEVRGVEAELLYDGQLHKCFVVNGRGKGYALERHGFTLSSLPFHLIKHVDLYDLDACREAMYPLCKSVLQSLLPDCKQIVVFDHILRNPARHSQETDTGKQSTTTPMLASGPVFGVHGDYTARSGFTRAQQLLEPHESSDRIKRALSQRFAFINVWVPLKKIERNPLALIEWDSVAPRDAVTITFTYTHRRGEVYKVLPSESHRFVYFPDMDTGECIVFKQFDSAEVGHPRFAFHSAFEDPTTRPSAPPRESMELRCIAFFGDIPADFAQRWPNAPDQELAPQHVEVGPVTDEW
jgi:hypothetical protein